MAGVVAGKHGARFGVADRRQHPTELGRDDVAAGEQRQQQKQAGRGHQRDLGTGLGQRKAEDALEIGETVVAAETGVVAEKQQHEGKGQRLGDDREIDALDARTEREPAEHERQQPRDQQHLEHGQDEILGTGPVPGELLPVEEYHVIGKMALVLSLGANFAHQVHAHGVATEREEQAVTQRQDAGVTPDKIQGQRHHRVAHEFSEQQQVVVGHVQRVVRRYHQPQQRDGDEHDGREHPHGDPATSAIQPGQVRSDRTHNMSSRTERSEAELGFMDQLSAARPFIANSPCGRF